MVDLDLVCNSCNSSSIIETREGYVCAECGVVLEIQKLEYHHPYKDIAIQHAVSHGSTQIGLKRERLTSPHSIKYERFNKLQVIKDHEKKVKIKARFELLRILNNLKMPSSYTNLILTIFNELRSKLKSGTKYRNFEKLIPISIYLTLKIHNVSVNKNELVNTSKISKKEFNAFLLQVKKFIPQYAERNRKKYISQKILEITEHFELGMPFYYQSKKTMDKFWDLIKNTTDDVIVGVVTSISLLCSNENKITVSNICNKLEIRMSTIHSQVKKIFERFRVKGFVSLVKSADELKKLMKNINVIEAC